MSSRNGALQRMRAIVAATVRLLVGGTWSVPRLVNRSDAAGLSSSFSSTAPSHRAHRLIPAARGRRRRR
ncbi:hypothetical protein BZL30_2605 [Mycobacterium kansasii]|uniref:Uncharacterized protein n=1 Tax=Mycobacterium kansasii TaxID=1768 RepID=A0A1V3XKB4_MYCKA|nr:hypothetical protein BZL30_2605 [Mycobacterium kansasii]